MGLNEEHGGNVTAAEAEAESLTGCTDARSADRALLTPGMLLVRDERNRQINAEGFDDQHDDAHDGGDLSRAGRCYAAFAIQQMAGSGPTTLDAPASWPFAAEWWKPSRDPLRNLTKAAALIIAEMDLYIRMDRQPAD
jgi:hypothetical protein